MINVNYYLGVSLVRAGRHAEVVEELGTAMRVGLVSEGGEVGPEDLYAMRAEALLGLGDGRRAEADLTEAIRIRPEARYYFMRGAARAGAGLLEGAVSDYGQALSIGGDSFEAYNNLGAAYAAMGRYQDAAGAFERAIELNPSEPGPHRNRARVLIRAGSH
jgi:tetratricopeptide (TPR) repeat protein